ncbi:MAG: hypothetical protein CM15mP111_0720 [Hyphomicrobiales bacterium]|nr:MAG: hypothetical protein CM15mP111_0720 [Hyphomicrobiales bacterium]
MQSNFAKDPKIRPNTVFGADMIAGFPTETDDMHRSTMQHINDCDITYLHVFPFSSKLEHRHQKCRKSKKYHSESCKRFKNARHAKMNLFLMREIGKEKTILIEKQDLDVLSNTQRL